VEQKKKRKPGGVLNGADGWIYHRKNNCGVEKGKEKKKDLNCDRQVEGKYSSTRTGIPAITVC